MLKLVILSLLFINLFANSLTIASYNVQNLFDLTYNNSEYKEYIPNTNNWNKETYKTKLFNVSKVIKQINADIIALQEVESKRVVKALQTTLPQYKYSSFTKYKNSSVGLAILSKIKIVDSKTIKVNFINRKFRPIQEATFKINNTKFKLFNNHWSSKKFDEKYRIKYAYTLFERIKKLPKDYDYLLLGDFNSNYNETETFANNKVLNTTEYISGINQVLNTTLKKDFIRKKDILELKKRVHYNLWLELPFTQRFSYKYKGENQTPDNILLSPALFDKKGLSYINDSFKVFKPNYLYKNRKINRWLIKKGNHLNIGYSDHLPILARFETSKYKKEKENKNTISKIEELYKIEVLNKPAILKECIVIFKDKNAVILKQKDSRAIYLYKKDNNFKYGFSYNIKVDKIKYYNGLKEISKYEIIKKNKKIANLKKLYLKTKEDLKQLKFQNEVVVNLKGIYKKNYFYYDKYKIRVYFKNKNLKPNKQSQIEIKKAQVGFYRSKPQLVIYEKEDFILQN